MKAISFACCLCVFAASGVAVAEPNAPSGKIDGYQYVFTDDPLAAGLFGANEARIVVRPGAARATLIRPRTAFVIELLKSVESL